MKALIREERAQWHEERMHLMQELSSTKQALSLAESALEEADEQRSVAEVSMRSVRSMRSLPERAAPVATAPPIETLKDRVRAALDAMSSLERAEVRSSPGLPQRALHNLDASSSVTINFPKWTSN
ncbi:unnamed protein product [Effrenium voratum]|nr:unnamed protein product [Effrenium voratum]